ncbi:site-specific DNA-methyltransferase [Methanomethylophilus alvi]|uniref:site-specific DNA-methyltransferase n=1 Tax=Methanomethylophilus alvi TaxID=1291540 RepID=UPI0037DCCC36
MVDKMRMESKNIIDNNVEELSYLFPAAVVEVKDEMTGKIEKKVDFQILQSLLVDDAVDNSVEHYEFTWPGKAAARREAYTSIRKTLIPVKPESKNWDTTSNLYIKGDNLEALKLLQESYLNKVKMIYIDPPYNTGSDLLYMDDFRINSDEYKARTEVVNESGERLIKNQESNGKFHSDWCSMIYSRLILARNLLREDGVIFISIDDNEVDNLKKICNEIFGESNFIGCAGRITKKANNQGEFWAPNFDYLLTFCKNKAQCPSFFGGFNDSSYNLIEEDGPRKGERYQLLRLYMTSLDPMRGCTNQRYYIECPDGTFIIPPGDHYPDKIEDGAHCPPQSGRDKIWRWTYQSYLDKKDQIVLKKGRSSNVVGANGAETTWNAFTKTYLKDVIEKSSATPNSFIEDHLNQNASHELKKLGIPFSFAKPTSLIKYLAEVCRVGNDDIIVDFFSGSGTTADALMQYNQEKGIKAKYILVQIPEKCDPESDAYKQGFKTITEIGMERIRRAGKQIESSLDGSAVDTGFRVFEIKDSIMKDVYYSPRETKQVDIEGRVDNIREEYINCPEALLYSVLLDWGLDLSMKVVKVDSISNANIYSVDCGTLVACFDANIDKTLIESIAKMKPTYAVFRDGSFNSPSSKINLGEIFKSVSPNTVVKVI